MSRNIITFENQDHSSRIQVIQAEAGEMGFDPIGQRSTLGVKWTEVVENDDGREETIYRGFWFDTTDMSAMEATGHLARRLILMMGNPDTYELYNGVTSAEVREGDASN